MQIAKAKYKATLRLMFQNYYHHNVGKNAAALAYYLFFALFPLLIFASNLLGLLDLDLLTVTHALRQILPNDIVSIFESYLNYISQNSSHTLMWFSLIFSIWFPTRAARGLMDDVRRAYGLAKPKRPVAYTVRQLLYTLVFLVVIALTLILVILSESVLGNLIELISQSDAQISGYLLQLWQYLRFLPVSLLMLAAIGSLYVLALERRQPIKAMLPGILAALPAWMLVSIGFSFYVEHLANYSLIYGTLGAMIVLLIWLYMTAVILILGAELNAALAKLKESQIN